MFEECKFWNIELDSDSPTRKSHISYTPANMKAIIPFLFNTINNFANQASYIETITQATIDRIHAIVNPYVGQIFNGLFEGLIPILNDGLSALYKKVFAKVLAATQNITRMKLVMIF